MGVGRKAAMVGEIGILGAQPLTAPAPIAAAGPEAERAFWEYFVAAIRNRNTRRPYRPWRSTTSPCPAPSRPD
jgi:hypothetical protein